MTSTNRFGKKTVLYSLLTFALAFIVNPAWAQDDMSDEQDSEDAVEEAQDESTDLGRIVVTGSRLQRETYTSIQPLQIITAEGSREAGLVDAADILQTSTAAGGQQIDLTFSGFVLDNGPGAQTLSLRGLGANRTLLLLNGRRLAPSGVEGAPSAPDLSLVPASMVQRYEVLLDGASSIYGSDAVAGVTNIIMRKDYDGLELDGYYSTRDQGDGDSYTVNGAFGKNFDRGFFGIGVEYVKNKAQRLADSDWTDQCEKHREIDQNGNIRELDLYHPEIQLMPWDECVRGSLAARTYQYSVSSGSIYYTPGFSNGGWGNFSENNLWGVSVDSNGDGINDVNWKDYDLNGGEYLQNAMLYPENDRTSIMGYGEYTFEGEMNNTAYFEVNFNKRNVHQEGGGYQLFPDVPPNNPYNLCNPNGINGVDCGLAQDALYDNPGYRAGFFNRYGAYPEDFGLYTGPIGPSWTEPIVSVQGDRVDYDTKMEQFRYVVGIKGDLTGIDWGSMNSWQYDMAYSHTNSDGTSSRMGVRDDRLVYSLATSRFAEDGSVVCGDGSAPCVPINMYAPSLYPLGTVVGDFATQAERDYLFDDRNFRTKYTQNIFNVYADGYLFEMQGGTAMGGVGFEYRTDEINSLPDEVARDGLLFGFFADGGAVGKKSTTEFFGEIEMPILAGKKFADELIVNLSGRYTSDQIYGSDTTWSGKLGWRPIPSLLLRGTYGTSFRAPNLREVFLQAQTGFNNGLFDPCVVPEEARGDFGGGYDPTGDDREAQIFVNCENNGVDPYSLGIADNRQAVYSVEVATGGSRNLQAETSQSYTYGFAFDQPWFDTFDLTFGATYWNINIDDTIVEPSSQFLVNDCYNDPDYNSAFCSQINRDADGYIDLIDAGFINRDNQKVSGVDVNLNYDQTFNIGSQAIAFGADLVLTHTEEASETFVDDNGNEDYDDDAGEWGYPDWKGQLGLRTNIDDFRFTWVINYIGKVDQDPLGIDEFDDIYGIADTCLGPPDDVLCRDVGFGDAYWLHSASLYWYGDTFTVGAGIRNVFDEAPPLVDGTEVLSVNNVPIGYGYDLRGRTFFFNVTWRP
jgi:iron complex outermembrane receptor protein